MDQLALYDKILQLTAPWKTENVQLDEKLVELQSKLHAQNHNSHAPSVILYLSATILGKGTGVTLIPASFKRSLKPMSHVSNAINMAA